MDYGDERNVNEDQASMECSNMLKNARSKWNVVLSIDSPIVGAE